jgi:Prp8 binding protein
MTTSVQGPAFDGNDPPHKRIRVQESDDDLRPRQGQLVEYRDDDATATPRSSSLPAPTLQLTGHAGSVYALAYSPSGQTLCSASFDKTCLLWNHGTYENFKTLTGHKNAVLDVTWCDEDCIVTASADKAVFVWDALTGTRLRQWKAHEGVVNAVDSITEHTVVSASDDGTCRVWDRRQKSAVMTLRNNSTNHDSDTAGTPLPITALAATSTHAYTGGIDNLITCWDLKTQRKQYAMKGHADTITSLAMHPEETHVLSNSMDNTLQSWDIRPFVTGPNRHHKTCVGHKRNAEKGLLKCAWSGSAGGGGGGGSMVTAGSADKFVHVWDEFSTEELYLLPGHQGCVNVVAFHPVENVVCSGSSDKQIYVGELS